MTIHYLIPVNENPTRISQEDGDQLVADSNRKWHDWISMTQDIRTRGLEAMQLYLENRPDFQEFNKPDDIGQSRVRRPVLGEAVDSVCAQQHLSSFPGEERFFKVRPRNKITSDLQDIYAKHTEARLSQIDFMINHYKHRLNKILTGVSAVWHPAFYEEELITTYQFPTVLGFRIPGKATPKQELETTLQFTGFIPLSMEDWLVEPTVDSLKEANFIWRRWMPVEELKAVQGLKNKDDIQAYQRVWDELDSDKSTKYTYMGIQQSWEDMDSPLCEHVLLYEEWGDFYLDGEFYPNHVLLYSNDSVFHGFFPNPYNHQRKPFTVSPYIPLPGTLYGKSMAQDIIPLAHALDSMLNQQLDAFGIIASAPFTYLIKDEAVLEYFKDGPVSIRPGEGVPVESHDSLKPIQWPMDALTVSEGAQQRLKEEIRESTGGVPYATGGVSEQDTQRTATEVNTLTVGTNTRFQLLIQMDEEQVCKPYLEMVFENDRQFMDVPAFVDDEPKPLMPDTVKMMDLRFDVTGSRSIASRAKEAAEMKEIIAAIPGWIQSGLVVPNGDILKVNIPEMLKRAVAMNTAFRDLDNFTETVTLEQRQEEQQGMPNIGEVGINSARGAVNGPGGLPPQINPGGAPATLAAVSGNGGVVAA